MKNVEDIEFLARCRSFFNQNGYIPWKAADRLLTLCEKWANEKIPDEKYRGD